MSLEAFEDLVAACRLHGLQDRKPRARLDAISPEVAVSMTIRYLAGGVYQDISDVHRVSESTFFEVLHRTLDVLGEALKGETRFPSTPAERQATSTKFSTALPGCISALDGRGFKADRPRLSEISHPMQYFNRKGYYSILLLAAADKDALFTWYAVNFPGSSHDSSALKCTRVFQHLEASVPPPFWIAADAAFPCKETIITPYPGAPEGLEERKRVFNAAFSAETRNSIERAFGLLTKRWQIFRRPLACSWKRNFLIISVCVQLHNFCMRRRAGWDGTREDDLAIPRGLLRDAEWDFDSQEAWQDPTISARSSASAVTDASSTQDSCREMGKGRGARSDLEKSARRGYLADLLFHNAGLRRTDFVVDVETPRVSRAGRRAAEEDRR